MNKTFEFLKNKTQVNFLSTIDGNEPSCRPFGDPVLFDNKIYVITNKKKAVSKQIAENNSVCIVAYDNENWIRIKCKLIDDSDNMEVKQAIIHEFDWAVEAAYTLDNPNFQVLYMSDVISNIYDEDGNILFTEEF